MDDTSIPRSVLSEALQARMSGRRLIAAVFMTFALEPGFFEREVLPVFFDAAMSHIERIRVVQLEEFVVRVPEGIAVYYDPAGLARDGEPARLDVRRVPVRQGTGLFHPKHVLLLVEPVEPDESGRRPLALVVATTSANLTRAGWWTNVEACHIEELAEGEKTRLRDGLVATLEHTLHRARGGTSDDHRALRAILGVVRGCEQRPLRSADGRLHTHFFVGGTARRDDGASLPDFLADATQGSLRGMKFELMAPFVERAAVAELVRRFAPAEVRVLLPEDDSGAIACSPDTYEFVRTTPGLAWGRLPEALRKRGTGSGARGRHVHAKVIRCFTERPKREFLFVGSPNLTTPAHQHPGGNFETGVLVEVLPPRRPTWWLEVIEPGVPRFAVSESEEAIAARGSPLSLRFWWGGDHVQAFWDGTQPSPAICVRECAGPPLFSVSELPPREWHDLPAEAGTAMARVMRSTSLVEALIDGGPPGLVLVQEEGMERRTSLLFDLTPAEILRYWALLSAEQRAAFLEQRTPAVVLAAEGSALVVASALVCDEESMFDQFAGIFHAFACLEEHVRDMLAEGREKEAVYRLFGERHDSLGTLLRRLRAPEADEKRDLVVDYVQFRCAGQLVKAIAREFSGFWSEHREEVRRLMQALNDTDALRERLVACNTGDMGKFLDWFDHWFMRRARPLAEEELA